MDKIFSIIAFIAQLLALDTDKVQGRPYPYAPMSPDHGN
jgi:hypothetical protein